MSIWDDIGRERRELAGELEGLSPEQWDAPSLCDGWTVKATAAHLTMPFHYSIPKLMTKMVVSGGFNRAASRIAIQEAESRTTSDIVEELRANADHRFTPPGMGPEAPLADIVLHGQDIRRAIGMRRDFPESASRVVLDLLASKKGKFARPRGGIDGLHFEATDMEWSSGVGPTVHGAAEPLLVAMAGRTASLDDLGGEGLATFRSRF